MKSFSRFLAVTFTALVLSGCAAVPAIAPFAGEIATAVKQAYSTVTATANVETSNVSTVPSAVLPHCDSPLATATVVDPSGSYKMAWQAVQEFEVLAKQSGCFAIVPDGAVKVTALRESSVPWFTANLQVDVTYTAYVGGRNIKATGGKSGGSSDGLVSGEDASKMAFEKFVAQTKQFLAIK